MKSYNYIKFWILTGKHNVSGFFLNSNIPKDLKTTWEYKNFKQMFEKLAGSAYNVGWGILTVYNQVCLTYCLFKKTTDKSNWIDCD